MTAMTATISTSENAAAWSLARDFMGVLTRRWVQEVAKRPSGNYQI